MKDIVKEKWGNSHIVTGADYARMIQGAYRAFAMECAAINALNVFPVPDGDTGTNMLMTMEAAQRGLLQCPSESIALLSKAASESGMMGARGNSGVILSQIFRGIARGLAGKEQASSSEISKAFQYGVLYAYRSVARPVEGTILTVAKGIAKGAHRAVREKQPFAAMLRAAIAAGQAELARTPELLPALKRAGVVDAGGRGLLVFLEGCLAGLTGEDRLTEGASALHHIPVLPDSSELRGESWDRSRPYCTSFFVRTGSVTVKEKEAREILQEMGDSLVLAWGETGMKIHIHASDPGLVLSRALDWGSLHDVKIENMADQAAALEKADGPGRPEEGIGLVSVVAGDGLREIMAKMGAGELVDGGVSMNPPVEAFVSAVRKNKYREYILLPNNRNIILAAMQAKKILGDRVTVVPTVNIPQGLAALLAFDGEKSLEENQKRMTARLASVRSGGVTQAVRDSNYAEGEIRTGDYIGVVEGKVVVAGATMEEVLTKLARHLSREDSEILTLYYGAGMEPEAGEAAGQRLQEAMPDLEVETYYGGQPLYYFLLSAE